MPANTGETEIIMKVIEFKDLYFTDFNITNYIAINNKVEDNQLFSIFDDQRTTSVFVHLKDCNIKYIFENGTELFVPKGSIVYIPHSAKYYVNYQSCTKPYSLAQLVAFELRDKDNEQFIASNKIIIVCESIKNIFSDIFDEAVTICDTYPFSHIAFKALIYSVITEISKQYITDKMYSKEFYSIAPSIEYLRKNLYSDISISELAKISHLSESCFRRLFKKHFGIPPSDYINSQKIKKAKKLLQSNMYSINEISQILGYDDPSYFSKVFKKQTGFSPGKYRTCFQM